VQHRFNEQVSVEHLASITIDSTAMTQPVDLSTNSVAKSSESVLEMGSVESIDLRLPVASSIGESKIDFAIITAIRTERLAVLKCFGIDEDIDRSPKEHRTYWRKRLALKDGKFYEIVVAQSLDTANLQAALLTNDMLHHWKPNSVLMVGIAAAAEPIQCLGDLIIGKEVYYYEMGKVVAEGKIPEPKQIPVDATLLDRVQALPNTNFLILADRPDGTATFPSIELGVIASGDKVISDEVERDKIVAVNRKIMAIEMEGYGVSSAAWQSFERVRCLVIRALCDYADNKKNDQWHEYAAAVAAGYTKHLLLDEPLPPRNPPESPE
jgi:nucleoside phosphorylase